MKRSCSWMVALLFAAISGLPQAQAELLWEQTELSFEPKFDEKTLTGAFPFKNSGAQPIRIGQIAVSCPCTTAITDKQEYQPGESGVLTAKIDAKGFLWERIQYLNIGVKTSDKNMSMLKIKIKIPGTIKVHPTAVFWLKGEAQKPKEILLEVDAKTPAKTMTVATSDPAFECKIIPQVEGRTYRLIVTPQNVTPPKISTFTIEAQFSEGRITRGSAYARVTGP